MSGAQTSKSHPFRAFPSRVDLQLYRISNQPIETSQELCMCNDCMDITSCAFIKRGVLTPSRTNALRRVLVANSTLPQLLKYWSTRIPIGPWLPRRIRCSTHPYYTARIEHYYDLLRAIKMTTRPYVSLSKFRRRATCSTAVVCPADDYLTARSPVRSQALVSANTLSISICSLIGSTEFPRSTLRLLSSRPLHSHLLAHIYRLFHLPQYILHRKPNRTGNMPP